MRTGPGELFPRLDAELGDPAALAGFFFRRAGWQSPASDAGLQS